MFIGGYPYWYPYPYYAYPYASYAYPYTYPFSPRVVDPPVYIEQAPSQYWYYCRDPEGYYPHVSECPGGWLPVAPRPLPPAPPSEPPR